MSKVHLDKRNVVFRASLKEKSSSSQDKFNKKNFVKRTKNLVSASNAYNNKRSYRRTKWKKIFNWKVINCIIFVS